MASIAGALLLTSCAGPSSTSASSKTPPAASNPAGASLAIALKGSARVFFRAGNFEQSYSLQTESGQTNSIDPGGGQAYLDFGSSSTQRLGVTVVGGGASGATLKGPDKVLALFDDSVAREGGISTVGQGLCVFALTEFGSGGLGGELDCENVAPAMGASAPVRFQASISMTPS